MHINVFSLAIYKLDEKKRALNFNGYNHKLNFFISRFQVLRQVLLQSCQYCMSLLVVVHVNVDNSYGTLCQQMSQW